MKRTDQQRKALEVFCKELAKAMNDAGNDVTVVLTSKLLLALQSLTEKYPQSVPTAALIAAIEKNTPKAHISWTQESMKEVWRIFQTHLFPDKPSTTQLTTGEVNVVYEEVNKFTAERFGVHVPFPSDEDEAA